MKVDLRGTDSPLSEAGDTLSARAYDAIEQLIVQGGIAPGELVSETLLSRQVGIGRTPVREALQRLQRDQLVEVEARRGVRVREVDVEQFRQAAELRAVLDPIISNLAALSASRHHRAELLDTAAGMEAALARGDRECMLDLEADHNRITAEACRNPLLIGAARPIYAVSRRFLYRDRGPSERLLTTANVALMRAIAAGDVPATAAACARFLSSLSRFGPQAPRSKQFQVRLSVARSSAGVNSGAATRAREAFQRIESRIVSQAYAPGETLSELRLSVELGIGRTPVREALQRLAAYHLISVEARRGAVVAELNSFDLATLNEARRPLERLLSQLAARNATKPERATLNRLARDWEAAARRGDTPSIIALDERMKAMLAYVAANPFLEEAIAPIHSLARRLYFQRLLVPDLDVAAAQADLLRAIAGGGEHNAELAANRFIAETVRAIRHASGPTPLAARQCFANDRPDSNTLRRSHSAA